MQIFFPLRRIGFRICTESAFIFREIELVWNNLFVV